MKSGFCGESPAISVMKLLYSHCELSCVSLFSFARMQKRNIAEIKGSNFRT